jgi:hypothetical protein
MRCIRRDSPQTTVLCNPQVSSLLSFAPFRPVASLWRIQFHPQVDTTFNATLNTMLRFPIKPFGEQNQRLLNFGCVEFVKFLH